MIIQSLRRTFSLRKRKSTVFSLRQVEQNLETVSYTHLDVYKRQLIYCEFMVTDTRNYTYLNSAECKDYFHFLKDNLEDIYYSSYFAEVAEYFTMEGQDERNILNLLFVTFLAMKKKLIPLSLIRRIYELKILQFAGFGLQCCLLYTSRCV